MFKIYQIHRLSGQDEDFSDYIVCSYLHKEKAEIELQKLNEALKEYYALCKRCEGCPARFGCSVEDTDSVKDICPEFSYNEDEDSLIVFCRNSMFMYEDNISYKIEEIDVNDEN